MRLVPTLLHSSKECHLHRWGSFPGWEWHDIFIEYICLDCICHRNGELISTHVTKKSREEERKRERGREREWTPASNQMAMPGWGRDLPGSHFSWSFVRSTYAWMSDHWQMTPQGMVHWIECPDNTDRGIETMRLVPTLHHSSKECHLHRRRSYPMTDADLTKFQNKDI